MTNLRHALYAGMAVQAFTQDLVPDTARTCCKLKGKGKKILPQLSLKLFPASLCPHSLHIKSRLRRVRTFKMNNEDILRPKRESLKMGRPAIQWIQICAPRQTSLCVRFVIHMLLTSAVGTISLRVKRRRRSRVLMKPTHVLLQVWTVGLKTLFSVGIRVCVWYDGEGHRRIYHCVPIWWESCRIDLSYRRGHKAKVFLMYTAIDKVLMVVGRACRSSS